MTATAAELAAAEAWSLVMRDEDAMPPWAARDYVQDHTGDRDAAVSLLCHAAADWLYLSTPNNEWPNTTNSILWLLRNGRLDEAGDASNLGMIREHHEVYSDLWDSKKWLAWCDDADRALAACRAMTEGV